VSVRTSLALRMRALTNCALVPRDLSQAVLPSKVNAWTEPRLDGIVFARAAAFALGAGGGRGRLFWRG
jgi:hypothetical protein